ncbi:MAG: hypothetical protein H7221_07660 [Flavobacterium sp.]|nr:hypothetical protein [Flavobacterium sp.]
MKILLLFFSTLLYFSPNNEKTYIKEFYANKKIKAEGWIQFNKKQDYWYFYNENGSVKEEGHYINNKKTKWWIFYNSKNVILRKCEFTNDKQDGFSIIYENGDVVKAEKYTFGKKIKEWQSIAEFKKDNTDLL